MLRKLVLYCCTFLVDDDERALAGLVERVSCGCERCMALSDLDGAAVRLRMRLMATASMGASLL